jgi:hypothetical protein
MGQMGFGGEQNHRGWTRLQEPQDPTRTLARGVPQESLTFAP